MSLSPSLNNAVFHYGPMLARLFLAAVFLYSGADKLLQWRASVAEVAALGLPWPPAFAGVTLVVQLLGGLAVATGFGTEVGALLLAGFTVAATVIGHRFWLLHGNRARQEFTTSLEHLAIVGGLILIAVYSIRSF